MITILTGGTGGAKFVQGVVRALSPEDVTVIVNTGDDLTWWGLHVSPDLDTVTYALAGLLSRERGWGVEGDTFECLSRMRQLGAPAWFQLGDRDLAAHLRRTQLVRSGHTLSQATQEIARSLKVTARILPMSNDRVETRLTTATGELSFQEYFVRERFRVSVRDVRFAGAEEARPAPGVLDALREAHKIVIAPSNPVTSIGPILAVPGIREALRTRNCPVAAVSPIVGGAAVSGPAADLMRMRGWAASIVGVAEAYRDFLDVLVADQQDAASLPALERLGIESCLTNTIMDSDHAKIALARATLAAISRCGQTHARSKGAR